jgi:hypothetical protein
MSIGMRTSGAKLVCLRHRILHVEPAPQHDAGVDAWFDGEQ